MSGRSRHSASRSSRRSGSTGHSRGCRSSCTPRTATRHWPGWCSAASRERPHPVSAWSKSHRPTCPRWVPQEFFDVGTSGPSRNFVYDMETYRYFVRDDWEEILAHDADGRVTAGSFDALEAAQMAGREIKVGIRDLAADLATGAAAAHYGLHAHRVGLPTHGPAAVCRPHPPARPGRARGSAALPLGRLGCRLGLPPDGRSRGASAASSRTGGRGRIARRALHVGGSPARFRS